jgi:hypothetical protein
MKKYQKLVLNILKIIKSFTLIYNIWGLNSRKPPWKLHPNVWPMSTHAAHGCSHTQMSQWWQMIQPQMGFFLTFCLFHIKDFFCNMFLKYFQLPQ